MGISGLATLFEDVFPNCFCNEIGLKKYSGKTIAMDAYQYLYQSMKPKSKNQTRSPKLDSSPILHTFYICSKLLKNGIKPLFVFDGKSPKLKSVVIKERTEKREIARKEYKQAEIKGDTTAMAVLKTQTVKVGKKEVKNCKGLLKLMGIPYFYAPGEAEAQCAKFVESGLAFASATQDLDALTFGTKVVLRHLPFTQSRLKIQEVHLDKLLEALQLELSGFIELCILLGCDYCEGISGLGAHRAIELVHKHGSIEQIVENLDTKRFSVPNNWLYKEARQLFLSPNVKNTEELNFKWNEPNEEGIIQYLQDEKHFDKNIVQLQLQQIRDQTPDT